MRFPFLKCTMRWSREITEIDRWRSKMIRWMMNLYILYKFIQNLHETGKERHCTIYKQVTIGVRKNVVSSFKKTQIQFMIEREGTWVKIRLCVDGTFASVGFFIEKVERNLDFDEEIEHIRSTQSDWYCYHSENVAVSVTTKFWESEHLTSVSMFSAQGNRSTEKKITEKRWLCDESGVIGWWPSIGSQIEILFGCFVEG